MNYDEYKIDSHKLMYHPKRVAQWLEAGNDWEKIKKVYPIYAEISPAGSCNHRCIFCAMDYIGYKSRILDLELMGKILPEMGLLGVKSIMFAGEGEPLLCKKIDQLADLTVKAGIDVSFTTNGVLLTQKLADNILPVTSWLKVSLDAGTAETYSKIHNTEETDFKKVINNLKYAIEYINKNSLPCAIGAQMLLLPENANEVETLAKICRDEIGLAYLVIKPYSQHRFSGNRKYEDLNYRSLVSKVEKINGLSDHNFKIIYRGSTIKKHMNNEFGFNTCNAVPLFWAYIMSNLDVYACSAFLNDERFLLGNLRNSSFQEVWEGEKRRLSLEMMRNEFNIKQCRVNCRMNSVNAYLWELQNPHPHVNFI